MGRGLAGYGQRCGRIAGAALVLAATMFTDACAQPNAPAAAPTCNLNVVGQGVVANVVDGRTIMLTDGPKSRLAAIEVAPLAAAIGLEAKRELEAMLAGKPVELRGRALETDRYDRVAAHVFRADDGPARWIAAEMVARGHAR